MRFFAGLIEAREIEPAVVETGAVRAGAILLEKSTHVSNLIHSSEIVF